MKILLISSSGGHFKQLMRIFQVIRDKNCDIKIVSVKKEDTKDKADYFITEIARNPINFVKNKIESFNLIKKLKPDLIISTGAGTALNTCIFGKLFFDSKILFIDSVTRVKDLSLTGKIIYNLRLADKFLVQWPKLKERYPRAEYWGRVF